MTLLGLAASKWIPSRRPRPVLDPPRRGRSLSLEGLAPMADGPFSRVYHQLADEYPEVYDSPDLAGYIRLLVLADQAFPSAAHWAGVVSRAAVQRLSASGLVILDGGRYRIRGLDKERAARSESARRNALARWGRMRPQSDGNATALRPQSSGNASREQNSTEQNSNGRTTPPGYKTVREPSGSGRPT